MTDLLSDHTFIWQANPNKKQPEIYISFNSEGIILAKVNAVDPTKPTEEEVCASVVV